MQAIVVAVRKELWLCAKGKILACAVFHVIPVWRCGFLRCVNCSPFYACCWIFKLLLFFIVGSECAEDQSRTGIHDTLEFLHIIVGNSIQETVAIV